MAGLTPETLLRQRRVTSLAASKDGQALAFAVKQYDWDASRWTSQIWVYDRRTAANRVVAPSSEKCSDHSPSWMDGGRTLVFLSDRGCDKAQLWQIDINDDEPTQLTHLPLPIESYRISHAIGAIIFSTKVVAGDANHIRATVNLERKKEQQKARFFKYDRLFVRRWNDWIDGRISKLFLLFFTRFGTKYAAVGYEQCLMSKGHPGDECPVPPFGDNSHYDISPDGKEIAYCSHEHPHGSPQAWSTFVSVKTISIGIRDNYIVEVTKSIKIPSDSEGYSCNPTYSNNGRYIAFLSMKRPGYESDWKRIGIFDRNGNRVTFMEGVPVSPSELIWSPNSDSLFVTGNYQARKNVYQVPLASVSEADLILSGGEIHGIAALRSEEKVVMAYLKNTASYPDRVYIGSNCIFNPNETNMKGIVIPEPEDMWFAGANRDKVHSWLLKPVGFGNQQQWPLVVIIHGGPQGCITDSWHYRY